MTGAPIAGRLIAWAIPAAASLPPLFPLFFLPFFLWVFYLNEQRKQRRDLVVQRVLQLSIPVVGATGIRRSTAATGATWDIS